VLDGFTIARLPTTTTAGVTIDGATGAALSRITIDDNVSATASAGVNVLNGGVARVVRSSIYGGGGTSESFGVHSIASTVVLEENCTTIDAATGHCTSRCYQSGGYRIQGSAGLPNVATAAVWLEDSPDSLIESSLLCAPAGNGSSSPAALHVSGEAAGLVVHASTIEQLSGDQTTHRALWLEACAGAAPWIVDNHSINADSGYNNSSMTYAIQVLGDCHPVIDHNREIRASAANTNTHLFTGLYVDACAVNCGAAGSVKSRCVIEGNDHIYSTGFAGTSHVLQTFGGVSCSDGACAKISRNGIIGRDGASLDSCNYCGSSSFGLSLGSSGAFVDGNTVDAGCAVTGNGMTASSSGARIQNNSFHGTSIAYCGGHVPTQNASDWHSSGVSISETGGGAETDFNSNLVYPGQGDGPVMKFSRVGDPATGVIRNNQVTPYCSGCEMARVLEGNDICYDGDGCFSHTDSGVTTGAPLWDRRGYFRDAAPDIGPDEKNGIVIE
jgi:hypothetical protein